MRKVMVALCVGVILLVGTFGASAQTNDAWIPGLASFVLPGLGQFINDEMDKALIHLGIAVALDVGAFYVAKDQGFTIGLVENGIGFAVNF